MFIHRHNTPTYKQTYKPLYETRQEPIHKISLTCRVQISLQGEWPAHTRIVAASDRSSHGGRFKRNKQSPSRYPPIRLVGLCSSTTFFDLDSSPQATDAGLASTDTGSNETADNEIITVCFPSQERYYEVVERRPTISSRVPRVVSQRAELCGAEGRPITDITSDLPWHQHGRVWKVDSMLYQMLDTRYNVWAATELDINDLVLGINYLLEGIPSAHDGGTSWEEQ
ncbi:hypothetical protein GQ44DRAFT_65720 [Phaeosphaeriaceae sp. PMI808]|nr:hypothetical protein GQ44DRAFT_65720 [Phaeosphaeriaceae sp. PMI808]